MRIHRLTVRNFRGIESCEIELPTTGVTIVEGGNEVGKSSLAEALDLVFHFPDNSKSSRIRDVQPVHRDVGPEVEVELSTGVYRLVFSKRWLRRPSTTLTVVQPVREQLTGREAHDRVNQIIDSTLDRDLWNVLRLEQGGDLAQRGFLLPSLSRALDATVGADAPGPDDDDLWEKIVAERDRYWTATGRPSVDRTRLAERLTSAAEAVESIQAEIRAVEARTDEFARLEVEAVELSARQAELIAAEADAADRLKAVDVLRREVDRAEVDVRAASGDHERWLQVEAARARLVEVVEQKRRALAASEAVLAESQPAQAEAERHLAAATVKRSEALEALRVAERNADQAAADSAYRRRQIEVEQFRERLERVVEAQSDLERVEPILAGPSITSEVLAAMEVAEVESAKAEAVAAAGATVVQVRAEGDVAVSVDGFATDLRPGDVREVPVASSTEIVVPGLVSFTVEAGQDSRVNAERLEEARDTLARLCRRHGVSGLDEARRIASARADAERTQLDATKRLAADLRDLTVDGLSRKIASLRVRIAEFEAARLPEPPVPPDLDAAQEAEATAAEVLRRRRAELTAADAELDRVRCLHGDLGVASAAHAVQVANDRAAVADAEAALATARSDHPDEELAAGLETSAAERCDADLRLADARRRLVAADPEALEVVAASARDARQRTDAAVRDNRDNRRDLSAVIEHTGEQGLAHRLDMALAEVDRLQLEVDRLEARAAAALLLHDTFDRHRAEARQRYVAPFRDQIIRLGRIVFGDSLEVTLDDQLGIATRTLDGVTVGFHQLSTGTREQFALISRLACASLVSGDGEGAPVVFDDVLGWTDPQRLGQMAAAVNVAARHCQVILFTCTPGRFAGVGAASVVRMGSNGPTADTSLTA